MSSSDKETIQRLETTIGKLIECIKKHPDDLHRHEYATRYALVDPMLRALGWDVSDPAKVVPEYRIASFGNTKQYADYALFAKRRKAAASVSPSIILEAKKYKTTQQEMGKARKDARDGAAETNAQYFAFTDGNYWAMYKSSPGNEVTSFELHGLSGPRIKIAALCQKALPLAKSRLGLRPANTQHKTHAQQSDLLKNIAERGLHQPLPMPEFAHSKWVPLTKVHEAFWKSNSRAKCKFMVRLPDQTEKIASNWRGIFYAVCDWLDQKQSLGNLKTVLVRRENQRIFANTQPYRADGKKFITPHKASISGLYFELKIDAYTLMQGTVSLLEAAGEAPDSVYVKALTKI